MSDRVAPVLFHPLRNRVLSEYQGVACASDVARRLGRPLNLVSYHTGVLVRQGCLELVRTEFRHGARASYYRATVPPFIEDTNWSDLSLTRRRELTLNTLARTAGEVRRGALVGAFDAPHAHVSRSPLELDREGIVAVGEVLRRTFDELTRIAEAARRRDAERHPQVVLMLAFGSAPVAPDGIGGLADG